MADTTARIKVTEGIQMVAESGSGHAVIMDGSEAMGGREVGIRPMEMVLLGMGGCTTVDVLTLLRQEHHDVLDCIVELEAMRRTTKPGVFTEIKLRFTIKGKNIPADAVDRAIRLSQEKYCSACAMLGKTAEIKATFEIVEP